MDFAIPGAVIAERYRLTRPLGAGSSAVVWEAHDTALGRKVAVKLLRLDSPERLRGEAHTLARLAHPRIVTVFDYLDTLLPDGSAQPVLVTELLQGTGLDERLAAGPLPPAEAQRVCAQLADALRAAHQAGIVHRDLKPGNVMLVADGVKLLDFGIAQHTADQDPSGDGLAVGTPACMAPEQLTGQGAVPASDVYALGCLLYWCLTGHPPYPGPDIDAVVAGHLRAEPPRLDVPGLPPQVATLVQQCLAKNPAHRPSAGAAFGILSQSSEISPAHRTMVMPAYEVPASYPPPPSTRSYQDPAAQPTVALGPASEAAGYPEQPFFAPSAVPSGVSVSAPAAGRWTSPARLVVGAVLVAALAAAATAFALHSDPKATAGTVAGTPSSRPSASSAPPSSSGPSTSDGSSPAAPTPSGPGKQPSVTPSDPGGNPIGYLETMRAQIQGFIGQGTDVMSPNTGGDIQNAIADLQNAVRDDRANPSSKKLRTVQSKIHSVDQKITAGGDSGKIDPATADTLSQELRDFDDAYSQLSN